MKKICNKCNKSTKIIFKMGGLLCASCRVILFDNCSKEYYKELKKIQKKLENLK